MKPILASNFMERVFSQDSHHQSVSVIFTGQNYFEAPGKSKTSVRQCNYNVLFDSVMDKSMLNTIGCRINPGQPSILNDAFAKLKKTFPTDKHRYLLIDGDPYSSMSDMPVRTHIFPDPVTGEIEPICFFGTKKSKRN